MLDGEVTGLADDCIDWLGVPLKTGKQCVRCPRGEKATPKGVRFGDAEKKYAAVCLRTVAMVIAQRAEEQIRQQANLLKIAQDAIMVLDMMNNIVYWNKSAERVYGWTKEESI